MNNARILTESKIPENTEKSSQAAKRILQTVLLSFEIKIQYFSPFFPKGFLPGCLKAGGLKAAQCGAGEGAEITTHDAGHVLGKAVGGACRNLKERLMKE